MSSRVLFHFILYRLIWHVRKDLLFTQRILHHQLYVSWILDAQELWALDEQLKYFADMLAHIPTVDSGMKFSQQAQDSSLQIPNNSSALRSS